LGADRAITVNVLPNKPLTAMRTAVRMVRLLAPREPKASGMEVFPIVPEPPLGILREAIGWNPDSIRKWIDRGRADAEALIASPMFAAMSGRFV
jgi:hypothetical protein